MLLSCKGRTPDAGSRITRACGKTHFMIGAERCIAVGQYVDGSSFRASELSSWTFYVFILTQSRLLKFDLIMHGIWPVITNMKENRNPKLGVLHYLSNDVHDV